MTGAVENPSVFPLNPLNDSSPGAFFPEPGMSLRDYFAAQALPAVSDSHPEWQLRAWFGQRTGVTRAEVRAAAAYEVADAMLERRQREVQS